MIIRTLALFAATAKAEIVGCYLPYLCVRRGATPWRLVPAAMSLAAFAWLLTMHPSLGSGRTYAAYGGVYVAVAVVWMWCVDGMKPDRWDCIGATVTLIGVCIIAFAPRHA